MLFCFEVRSGVVDEASQVRVRSDADDDKLATELWSWSDPSRLQDRICPLHQSNVVRT